MPSLQRQIQVGYYAFAAAIASLALLAYVDLTYLQRHIDANLSASRLLDTVLEIRRYEKNWFLDGGPGALAEVRAYADQAASQIATARPGLAGLGASAGLDQLTLDLAAYLSALAQAPRAAIPGADPDGAQAVRAAGRRLAAGAETIAHAQHTRLQEAIGRSRSALLGVGALAILLGLVAARWLIARTTRPLAHLVEQLQAIAEGRDDQVRPVSDDREILAVSTALNGMLTELDERRRHLVQAEKLSSLGTLVSGVAHELNNPLSNCSSSCQILAEELDTADRSSLRQWVQQIDSETERARLIVRGLLDFSREGEFRKRPVVLRPLLDQTLRLLGRHAGHGQVALAVPADLTLMADPRRLQQVLLNLLRNALDAGGPEVAIRVSARVMAAADFRLPDRSVCGRSQLPRQAGAWLTLIEVTNSGPGIDPATLPRIFDPFFTTKDPGQGCGLGLFVSQEIIHQHSGCIGVESRPGNGTRFIIALPLDPTSDPTRDPIRDPTSESPGAVP